MRGNFIGACAALLFIPSGVFGELANASVETDSLGNLWLKFPTVAGKTYQVEGSGKVDSASYSPMQGGVFYGDGNVKSFFIRASSPSAGVSPTPLSSKPLELSDWLITLAPPSQPGNNLVMVVTRVKQPPESSWSIVTQQPIMRPFDAMGFTLAETRLELEESERLHQMTLNFNLSASPLDLTGIPGPETLAGADAEQWAKLDENKLRVMAFLSIPDDSAPPVPRPEGDSIYFRVRIIEGDTNSNTLPDWWELANNFNPYAMGDDAVDANSDADGDGYSNYEEYLAGSNPNAGEQKILHIPDSFAWLQTDLTDYRQIANEGDSPYPLFRFRYLKYWSDPSLDSRLSGQAVSIPAFANDPITTFGWPSTWGNSQNLTLNFTGLSRSRLDDFRLGGKFFRPTGSGTFDVGMTQNANVRLYSYFKSPFALTRRYLAVSHIRTYDNARDFVPSETFNGHMVEFTLPAGEGPRFSSQVNVWPEFIEDHFGGQRSELTLVPAEILVDMDRDGALALEGQDVTSALTPFRYWLNNDNDFGDTGGDDIPGAVDPNSSTPTVDGPRDLVDFFPVFLNLQQVLRVFPPGQGHVYRLSQADGAVNLVYTKLGREHAYDHHTLLPTWGYGDNFDQAPSVADTHNVPASGMLLSRAFLSSLLAENTGLLLMEGVAPTQAPLVLSIEKEGQTEPVAEIKLDLRLSPVEAMYRHVDLTSVNTEYEGTPITPPATAMPTTTSDRDPAWPDYLCSDKYFVFLHGFNVDAQQARGWHSEVFKRMHVLGSRARFVGVSWNGATGAKIGGSYTDYHKAVFHAFQAGDALGSALAFTQGGEVTLAAHSLGNMVASHAIQSGGFVPARYFMINAAVPLEAFDITKSHSHMVEEDWDDVEDRLRAWSWHELFSSNPSDNRNKLTWTGRFSSVPQKVELHNFYSPGEDVVSKAEINRSASVVETILNQGFDLSTGAWKAQELVKGVTTISSLSAAFQSRGQGGWQKNFWWTSSMIPQSEIYNYMLINQPYFGIYGSCFLEWGLTGPNQQDASQLAGMPKVQYDLLARAIPSRSEAVAVNLLNGEEPVTNFDMQNFGKNILINWPRERENWLHSDFKVVAFTYVYPMYDSVITKAQLK